PQAAADPRARERVRADGHDRAHRERHGVDPVDLAGLAGDPERVGRRRDPVGRGNRDAALDPVSLRVDADQPAAPVVGDPDLAEGHRDPVRLAAQADRLDHLVAARADAAHRPAFVRGPDGAAAERDRVRTVTDADSRPAPVVCRVEARDHVPGARRDPDAPRAVRDAEGTAAHGEAPHDPAGRRIDAHDPIAHPVGHPECTAARVRERRGDPDVHLVGAAWTAASTRSVTTTLIYITTRL